LDKRIRKLREARGLHFKPWEIPPWDVDDGPSPFPAGTAGAQSWSRAQKLRRRLIAEIKGKS
jgi:hypothetical protein